MATRDYCSRKPVTVDPDATVRSALQLMANENVGCVVVTEEGRPVGLLTDRDAALEVLTRRLDAAAVPVRELMHRPLQTVDADASLGLALSLLRSSRLRRLPVVDAGGSLVGILSLDDLLRLIATEVGDLAEAIRRQLAQPRSAWPARGDAS